MRTVVIVVGSLTLVSAGLVLAESKPAQSQPSGQATTQQMINGPAAGDATIKPDLSDIKYGPHERNVLDIYKAKSDKPTPLLVWIHGGGFSEGDKNASIRSVPVKELQAMGISVAAINYRYSRQAPAPGPFLDSCAGDPVPPDECQGIQPRPQAIRGHGQFRRRGHGIVDRLPRRPGRSEELRPGAARIHQAGLRLHDGRADFL